MIKKLSANEIQVIEKAMENAGVFELALTQAYDGLPMFFDNEQERDVKFVDGLLMIKNEGLINGLCLNEEEYKIWESLLSECNILI